MTLHHLLNHIYITTNFCKFFFESIDQDLFSPKKEKLVVADIGAGVGWTSAFISNLPTVKNIYIVEPSLERFNKIKHVLKHFNSVQGVNLFHQNSWIP